LVLSFKCPDSTGRQTDLRRKPETIGGKGRSRQLSDDDFGYYTSDSGIVSDASHLSTPSPATLPKHRDIFDSKKQKTASALWPVQRGARYAHLAGWQI
jgi:hypothetical protein